MTDSVQSEIETAARALSTLVCGDASGDNPADETLRHLEANLFKFSQKAEMYLNRPFDEEAQMFSAFVARAILENGVAAILGRIDPFRLLYLRNYQSAPSFEYGRTVKTGFRWQGDVLSIEKAPADLWSPDHDLSKVSRALLSDYSDELFWRPAIALSLDALASSGTPVPDHISSLDVENVIPSFRTRFAGLYSTLSKGVHWEFFIDQIVMDEATLKDSLRDTFLYLASIGLFTNFVPTAHAKIDPNKSIEKYNILRAAVS